MPRRSGLLSFIKRKVLRLSRDRWNHQYDAGRWQGLHSEDDRFRAVIGMLAAHEKTPAILEIGCGDAVLFRKMPAGSYARFTGVDISDVAIETAKAWEQDGVSFEAGDMKVYRPGATYDAIVFNESLYYCKEPVRLLKRYEAWLAPGGYFIVTAVDNKYTADFWPPIMAAYQVVRSEEVKKNAFLWRVRELRRQA